MFNGRGGRSDTVRKESCYVLCDLPVSNVAGCEDVVWIFDALTFGRMSDSEEYDLTLMARLVSVTSFVRMSIGDD